MKLLGIACMLSPLRMSRMLFCVLLSAFLFFEVANGTTSPECTAATSAFSMSACIGPLASLGSINLCNMTDPCQPIFQNILVNCSSTEPLHELVRNNLEAICNAPPGCFNATRDLAAQRMCDAARQSLSTSGIADPDLVCNGTCRTDLDNVVANCGNNATGAGLQSGLNALCNPQSSSILPTSSLTRTSTAIHVPIATPTADCMNATLTFINSTNCSTAINNNDTSTLCHGTCRTLLNNIVSACGDMGFVTRASLTERCGAAAALKGIGSVAILLMAIAVIAAAF